MVGCHIMVLWWGHSPRFLCYQLDFLLDFFTEEGSYQGLKDATSFGLLSDKSAEILGSEYSNFRQFFILADSAIFGLRGCGLNFSRVTSHVCAKAVVGANYPRNVDFLPENCNRDRDQFALDRVTGVAHFEYIP